MVEGENQQELLTEGQELLAIFVTSAKIASGNNPQ
jgi:hypothetical protein